MALESEFARAINTTLVNYIRKEEDNTVKDHKLTAMLQDAGRFSYNWSGEEMEQRVRYKLHALNPYGDMEQTQFNRQDLWKRVNLPWRAYRLQDAVSKKERLMNKGPEAIIKVFTEMGQRMKESAMELWPLEFYKDSAAAGNTKRMSGFDTAFSAVAGSESVADGYESPSATYANISTALANFGGSVSSGTWPESVNDAEYDFFTPTIIDYTDASSPWSDGSTWATNCGQVISALIIACQRRGSKKGMLDMVMTDMPMYRKFADKVRAKERIIVNNSDSKLVKLGFRDVIEWDGVDVTWEYGVPANCGYGINVKQVEVRSLQEQIWHMDQADWDPVTNSYRFALDSYAQMWFNPAYIGYLRNYGT